MGEDSRLASERDAEAVEDYVPSTAASAAPPAPGAGALGSLAAEQGAQAAAETDMNVPDAQLRSASHLRSSKAASLQSGSGAHTSSLASQEPTSMNPQQGVPTSAGAQRPADEAIYRAASDIFDALGPLDPRYRNPCFRNSTSGRLRCLPYFSIIGTACSVISQDLHFACVSRVLCMGQGMVDSIWNLACSCRHIKSCSLGMREILG